MPQVDFLAYFSMYYSLFIFFFFGYLYILKNNFNFLIFKQKFNNSVLMKLLKQMF